MIDSSEMAALTRANVPRILEGEGHCAAFGPAGLIVQCHRRIMSFIVAVCNDLRPKLLVLKEYDRKMPNLIKPASRQLVALSSVSLCAHMIRLKNAMCG